MKTTITSIIMTTDDHTQLGKTVRAIAGQDYETGAVETFVIDTNPASARNKSDRNSIERSDFERSGLRILEAPGAGRAAGRNLGFADSCGKIVIHLGDDFIPENGWLNAHLSLHAEKPAKQIVGIGPAFFPDSLREQPLLAWIEDSGHLFGASFTKGTALPPDYFFGSNTSFKREFLIEAGPFDEDFPFHTTDDWEMGIRMKALGVQTVYVPDAVTTHEHEFDLAARCVGLYQAGLSGALYDAKTPGGFSVPGYCTATSVEHARTARRKNWRWMLTRSKQARIDYWLHSFAAAYMRGYETYQRLGHIPDDAHGATY